MIRVHRAGPIPPPPRMDDLLHVFSNYYDVAVIAPIARVQKNAAKFKELVYKCVEEAESALVDDYVLDLPAHVSGEVHHVQQSINDLATHYHEAIYHAHPILHKFVTSYRHAMIDVKVECVLKEKNRIVQLWLLLTFCDAHTVRNVLHRIEKVPVNAANVVNVRNMLKTKLPVPLSVQVVDRTGVTRPRGRG